MGSFGSAEVLELDGCEVDIGQCELVRQGVRSRLTTKEVEVLSYLANHPARSVSYEELLEQVWGHSPLASTQPVYSVIKRLRRKVDGHGGHRHLVTVHGVGYRFEPARRARPRAAAPAIPTANDLGAAMRLASFVGRALELDQLDAALDAGARIVTLVGPGGAGKTRVAVEHRARLAARGERMVVVDLAKIRAPRDVARSIGAALGARTPDEEESQPDEASLAAAARVLGARAVHAILLDNAEHVLDAVAHAATSLASVTQVVVTSRERLAVPGEHVVEVGPMPPADGAALFVERAAAAGASASDSALVDEIVRRLDGLPLAIELAAAHAGVVSLERTRDDLGRQIDHLLTTRRGVPDRQVTLRSSVEWSLGLLSEAERSVLAQCAVFRGGFTIEAAEAVVRGEGSVRVHLQRLIERSLLHRPVPDGSADAAGRLALYACVHERAVELLVDPEGLADRHLAWAVDRVSAARALAPTPPSSAYAELTPELDNLRVAFRHALARDIEHASTLACAIDFLRARAHGAGGAPELFEALARVEGTASVPLRLVIGRSRRGGADGLALLEETRRLAPPASWMAIEADRLWAASLVARGRPGAALHPLEEALTRARELALSDASVEAASVLGRLGVDLAETHLSAGHIERAGELAEEAAARLEALGDRTSAARAASVLSYVHRERGAEERALAALEHARRLLEDEGDEAALARLALDRGVLLAHLTRTDEACDSLGAAVAAHRRLGLLPGEVRSRDWYVLTLLGLGRDEEALDQAREMQQLALAMRTESYEAERAFAATWLVTDRLIDAEQAFDRALTILAASGKESVRGHVLSSRALVRTLRGRLDEAESDLAECARIHGERGSLAAEAQSLAERALVREMASPREDTEALLEAAEEVAASLWERSASRARRAMLEFVRAQRADAPAGKLAAIHRSARADLLGGREAPADYFARCTLLLLDRVCSP